MWYIEMKYANFSLFKYQMKNKKKRAYKVFIFDLGLKKARHSINFDILKSSDWLFQQKYVK